jgi:anti-anti-sigma factor
MPGVLTKLVMLDVQPLARRDEFAIIGELDMSSAPSLITALQEPAKRGELRLLLEQLTFCDSSGVRALIEVARTARRITLVCPPDNVVQVFEMTGLRDIAGIVIEP